MIRIKLFEGFEETKLIERISGEEYSEQLKKIIRAKKSDVDRINNFFDSLGALLGKPRASITRMIISDISVNKIIISAGHETWYIDMLKDDYFLYKKYNRRGNYYYLIDGWDGLENFLKQKVGK